ncbi:MAG: serpin family protein [Dehalococcoidia bacterium]
MRPSTARRALLAVPLLVLATVPLAAACGDGGPSTAGIAEARSGRPRVTSPDVAPADLATLVRGNTAFALDLYRQLADTPHENIVYSPYSISAALAMTYAGARGDTQAEMAAALRFALHQARLHPAFNALDLALASRSDVRLDPDQEGEPPRLHIANSVWAEQTKTFLQEYLDVLAEHYGAGIRLVDFMGDPEAAREAINRWVEEQTEDRIKGLIPPGVIDPATRMVLTNAIYFKASWQYPFDEDRTADAAFTRLDGSRVTVPFMHLTESLRYSRSVGLQAVELPYVGDQLAMTIVVPDEGAFATVESSLDAAALEAIFGVLSRAQVQLAMPKFEFEAEFSLEDHLRTLGMDLAFEPGLADFSGMDGLRDLSISDVLHKAFISVDEAGTEAAAATAVVIRETSAPGDIVDLVIDRPFLFFLRDLETGTILFAGRVVDPS